MQLVSLTHTCQGFQCLPSSGGLFEQDSYLVRGMQLVLQVQGEIQAEQAAEMKAKANASRRT